MKKLITTMLILFSMVTFSQINIGTILGSGIEDTQTFLRGYLQPLPTGFGQAVNNGWYTTARAHKKFGFDISVVANASIIPSRAETFTFNNSDYANIRLEDGSSSAELPTIFGSQKLSDRPLLELTDSDTGDNFSTSTLPGSGVASVIGFSAVPAAAVQVGVGLFKNTDLKVRFVPKVSQDDFEYSTFGIGVMHDIKQWIPFVRRLPIDVSAFFAWDNAKANILLDKNNEPSQQLEFNTQTYLYQLLVSTKFTFLTVYGGVGAATFNSDLNLLGTYRSQDQTYIDPVALNFTETAFRGNVGFRMNLLAFYLSGDYSIQEFNTFSLGLGFTFR